MNNESFNKYIEQAIKENWERIALSDFDGVSYHYKDIARKIAKIHLLLESAEIKKGDKIAICGKNSAHWAVAFFAAITYGAVPVPILHEFKSRQYTPHCQSLGSKTAICRRYCLGRLERNANEKPERNLPIK